MTLLAFLMYLIVFFAVTVILRAGCFNATSKIYEFWDNAEQSENDGLPLVAYSSYCHSTRFLQEIDKIKCLNYPPSIDFLICLITADR